MNTFAILGRSTSQRFSILLSIFGLIMAVTTLFYAPGLAPNLIVFLSIFISLLLIFPIYILNVEISLAFVPVLGATLVYDAATSTTSVLVGALIGLVIYRLFPNMDSTRKNTLDFANALYEIGRLLFPILLANWLAPMLGNGPLFLIILFLILHTSVLVIEFKLSSPIPPPTLIQFSGSLLLMEILPIPFLYLAMTAFPDGLGGISIFAAFPTLVAILLNQNKNVRSDLNRRVQDLSAINEISNIIRYSTDLDSLLIAVHQQLRSLMGIKNFYVALYDEDDDSLWYPISVKQDKHQNWARRPLTNRLTDRVIVEKRPIMLAKNAHLELENIDPSSEKELIHAWLGVPLITPDKILGCLCIISFNPEIEFTQNDLELLTILSGQISVALENALLYGQMQKRSFQLETLNKTGTAISATLNPEEVYGQICKAAMQISGGQQTALYIARPPAKEAELVHSVGLSESYTKKNSTFNITGEDADQPTRKDIVLNIENADLELEEVQDLISENIKAYINLSFHTPDGNQACLSIFYDSTQTFPHEEIEYLQTFSTQASMALANAALYAQTDEALRKSVSELQILEEIGRKLSEALRSEDLFDLILGYAIERTQSPWGSIVAYNSKNNQFLIKAHRGYTLNMDDIWNMDGISGRAVQSQTTINISDVSKDSDYSDITDGKTRSQLSVPLIREEQILGVLTLESPNLNAYSEEEIKFVNQLADQAALAVLNAQLYDETQRWLNEQATLNLVSNRLASNQNLQSILNTVSQAFSAAMDSHLVGVYIRDNSSNTYQLRSSMKREANPNTPLPAFISQTQFDFIEKQRDKTGPLVINPEIELPEDIHICSNCQAFIFPLKFRGQMIGLSFVHIPADKILSRKELQLPQSIALQSSISIQNAILFSDVAQGRDRLQTVLDGVGEGVLMIDAVGTVTLVNTPIETITNTPIEEIQNTNFIGLPDHVLATLGYTYDQAYELIVQALKPNLVENQPKHNYKSGEHYLERSTAPVWDMNINILGWVIVIRDVTEEHQISQTRELLTETLVHDLRSPVGAVKTTLDLIEEIMSEQTDDPIIPQSVQIAQRSIDRVLGLIESLLDISQLESGSLVLDKEDADLVNILKETVGEMVPVANENDIVLTDELPKKLPAIRIDPNLIKRVIINLLDNAFKFSPEGGRVTLKAYADSEEKIIIQVIDSGPGIPIEYREKVFERFSQIPNLPGKRRGTGLGLTLCRLAVQAHGGKIWVESNSDEPGAIFTFTLPNVKSKTKQPT